MANNDLKSAVASKNETETRDSFGRTVAERTITFESEIMERIEMERVTFEEIKRQNVPSRKRKQTIVTMNEALETMLTIAFEKLDKERELRETRLNDKERKATVERYQTRLANNAALALDVQFMKEFTAAMLNVPVPIGPTNKQ